MLVAHCEILSAGHFSYSYCQLAAKCAHAGFQPPGTNRKNKKIWILAGSF
jgi:hypothetical protein